MAVVADVIASGLDAAKPAASASNAGFLYFSTDIAGGTLYRSTGAAWVAVAPGVSASASPSFSGCRCYKAANQAITNNTNTALVFDSESFDAGGYHDTVTNNTRITIPTGKTGKHLLFASLRLSGNAAQTDVWFTKNGASSGAYLEVSEATLETNCVIEDIFDLTAGDYIEVFIRYNTNNGTVTATATGRSPVFASTFLGA